ncbi:SRPBCC family protein [Nonomuraea rhodomycinica]|uniref:SRPBCC family protein n=1 Tax=Nonomuraea rhodomycinica TaxID=1712872 RepID=A0A7Y6MA39_9ACTN|nr:SRPBCC family protein [Nonomuraea rhodomycinica]NUW39064.1 SRPBCC family protein [Nonomuraea rhodomycinica]
MAEYEATREMPADSATVFEVASDVDLVNRWLPHGLHVRGGGEGVVEAAGDVVPGGGEHEGLFGASRDQLRVEWGGRDHPEYAGWLQVADRADGASEVTVHISLLDEPEDGTARERGEQVRSMLDESLDRLAGEVARRS